MFHSAIAPVIAAADAALDEAPALELAVVAPVFNEAANVEVLIARLEEVLAGIAWEVIFVDDHSPDGTAALLRSLARRDRRIRIVERFGRRGLASAVVEGMLASAAPVLAVIDGDLQHDEALIPGLFAAVKGGADVAIGSRYMPGGGIGGWDSNRASVSRMATRVAGIVLPQKLSDPMSGFFCVSRAAFEEALPQLSVTGFKILLDILASAPRPLAVVELPYRFRTRTGGESKLDLKAAAEYLTLLADKTIGRLIPIRLLMFLMVGGLGVGVHLGVLGLALAGGAAFAAAQAAAVLTAMTFNFSLNNIFTYADRRLRGRRLVAGLLSFYLVCSIGALANVGIGTMIHGIEPRWWLAGVAGALIGAVWNFAASSVLTWRR